MQPGFFDHQERLGLLERLGDPLPGRSAAWTGRPSHQRCRNVVVNCFRAERVIPGNRKPRFRRVPGRRFPAGRFRASVRLAAAIVQLRGVARQVLVRVIERRVEKRDPGFLRLEIDGELAIHDERVAGDRAYIVPGNRVDGADQVVRLMQQVTRFPVTWQWRGGDPVEFLETQCVC